MKKIIYIALMASFAACGEGKHALVPAENDLDAGREFVRAALDGDFEKANFFLLKDSTNELLIKQQEQNYRNQPAGVRSEYKEASIRIIERKTLDDSTSTFRYYQSANSKDTTTLRIVKKEGQWLVDLKSVIKM